MLSSPVSDGAETVPLLAPRSGTTIEASSRAELSHTSALFNSELSRKEQQLVKRSEEHFAGAPRVLSLCVIVHVSLSSFVESCSRSTFLYLSLPLVLSVSLFCLVLFARSNGRPDSCFRRWFWWQNNLVSRPQSSRFCSFCLSSLSLMSIARLLVVVQRLWRLLSGR